MVNRFVNVRNKLLIKVTKIQSIIYFLKIKTTYVNCPRRKLKADNFLIELQKRNYTLNVINLKIELWLSKKRQNMSQESWENKKKLDQIKLNSSSFFWASKSLKLCQLTYLVNYPGEQAKAHLHSGRTCLNLVSIYHVMVGGIPGQQKIRKFLTSCPNVSAIL